MTVSEKRTRLGIVFFIMWMDVIGMSVFYPIAPFIIQKFSSDAMAVTLLTVIYSAAQFIAAPILGNLSDRYGRRPILLISLFGSAMGYLLFGFSKSLWMIYMSRMMNGFSGGNMSTTSAYISDISSLEERTKNLTLIGLAWGIGLITGPALGSALGQIDLMAPAFLAAGLMLLNLAFGFFLLPESLREENRRSQALTITTLNPLSSIWQFMKKPAMGRLLLIGCLFNLAVNGTNSIGSLLMMKEFSAEQWVVGAYLTVTGIGVILIQAIVPKMVKLLGKKRAVTATLLQQAFGGVAVFTCKSLISYLPVALINGCVSNMIYAPLTSMQISRIEGSDIGSLMGVTTSLNSLMSIFGPLWAGLAFDSISPKAPFLITCVLFLSAAVLSTDIIPGLLSHGSSLLMKAAHPRSKGGTGISGSDDD